jgi:hypothetical protein
MLTPDELAGLEATLLPALERHHLRLLAHGLRTLHQIADRRHGDPPAAAAIRRWVLQQDATAGDQAFAAAFSAQMLSVAAQLRTIAGPSRQALDLELNDLESWARHQADSRLANSQFADSRLADSHLAESRLAESHPADSSLDEISLNEISLDESTGAAAPQG